ncbi:MAG TPA: class I SAM-dependent methyltransferase [Bdellovibrionales bacterium]|jgi:SAM-dependent methyltransferase|nr:class I SAM-dependent methyltransferase [Bdellovibrionales bacterium]
MIFMTQQPHARLYEASYFHGDGSGYENYRSEFPAHYRSFRSRLNATQKILGRMGRLLDVGCALGHCGKAAKDLGWDTYVTDVSPFAVNEAARNFGLKASVAPIDSLPFEDRAFDCITLFDVIEHVSDPLSFLKEIRRTLRSDGIVQISTPDISSFTARIMGSKWYHYKPGEHLLYFNRKTLTSVLEVSGFEVIRIEALPISMRFGDILKRLMRYWSSGFTIALRISEKLGLADKIINIYAGELQAWARPINRDDRAQREAA